LSFLIVGGLTLLISWLTLFSGFGLGTLLLPVFLVFFDPPIAIAATAIVHLANNLLKGFLFARYANMGVLLRFSVPAILAAFAGAFLVESLNALPALLQYQWQAQWFQITPIRLTIGLLMIFFAGLDLSPKFKALTLPGDWIPVGGALSGFFGGLTGHQGAFRSAFLIRLGLGKEAFIGTTVLAAVLVDMVRIGVYGFSLTHGHQALFQSQTQWNLLLWAMVSAFLGTWLGSRWVQKVTLAWMQQGIGVLLMVYGLLLAIGLI
jgi:uncharacterized membrane protein YfcA